MAAQAFVIRIDPDRGLLDARKLRNLLYAVEDYLKGDLVDTDDEAAVLAVNVLTRHFDGPGNDDLTDKEWEE